MSDKKEITEKQIIVNKGDVGKQININYANKVIIYKDKDPSPFLVPPISSKIWGRDEMINKIVDLLLNETNSVIGLTGIPGIGKTSTAISIAHRGEIQQKFNDGVLWWGLGKDSDINMVFSTWLKAFGVSESELIITKSNNERRIILRNLIGKRKLLLILDDVWDIGKAAEILGVRGPNCAVIITSRKRQNAIEICSKTYFIEALDEKSSLDLLYDYVPNLANSNVEGIKNILDNLGGLPLAITLFARNLRRVSHAGQLRRVTKTISKYKDYKERLMDTHTNLEPDYYPSLTNSSISLWATIKLSEDELSKKAKVIFYSVSLFASKPSSFSVNAILEITKSTTNALDELIDAGLVETQNNERIVVHQVIHDYSKLFSDKKYEKAYIDYYFKFAKNHSSDFEKLDLEINNIIAALELLNGLNNKNLLCEFINYIYLYLETRGLHDISLKYLPEISDELHISQKEQFYLGILYRGRVLGNTGKYEEAEKCFTFVKDKIGLDDKWTEIRCDVYKGLGTIYEHYGKFEQSVNFLQEGIHEAKKMGSLPKEVDLSASLGYVLGLLSQFEEARNVLSDALNKAEEIGDVAAEAGLAINLGTLTEGELGTKYFKRALHLSRKINHRDRICSVLYNLGWSNSMKGNFGDAIQYLSEAIEISRAIGQKERLNLCLKQLAFVFSYKNQHKAAVENIEEAMSICIELENPRLIASCQLYESIILANSGKLDNALQVINQSLISMKELNSSFFVSWGLIQRGEIYFEKDDISNAVQDFTDGLEIAKEIDVKMLIGLSLFGLAKVSFKQGDIEKALNQGNESLTNIEYSNHFSKQEIVKFLEKLK